MCKKGFAAVLLLSSCLCSAKMIYVDCNSPNDPGTGTYADAFRRIQQAADDHNTEAGDIVEIRPGIYTGAGNYNIDPNGIDITIRGTEPNNPNIVAATIIDPNGAGRGFYFHSNESRLCVVSGLTITKAKMALGYGGAVYCDHSSPTILNCVIKNSSASLGGAVYCNDSNSLFEGCTINNNYAQDDGGAIECWWGNPRFKNCIIADNQAGRVGGAIDCWSGGNAAIENCTIVKNHALWGGGVFVDGSSPSVINSILWQNSSEPGQGPQIALFGGSTVSVSYSDVQQGQPDVNVPSGCTLLWNDNLEADPCFASFDPAADPNRWDLHPQSQAGRFDPNDQSWINDPQTSPCIDAGDTSSDYSKELWPNGKQVNIGAYGGTCQAGKNGNPADFDVDGQVNMTDFAELASKWMETQNAIEDLDGNGQINHHDFGIFTKNWLWEK